MSSFSFMMLGLFFWHLACGNLAQVTLLTLAIKLLIKEFLRRAGLIKCKNKYVCNYVCTNKYKR